MKVHFFRSRAVCLAVLLFLVSFTPAYAISNLAIGQLQNPDTENATTSSPPTIHLEPGQDIKSAWEATLKKQEETKAEKARQEFLAASNQPQVFDDVAPDQWHFPYVMTLYNKGGVSGLGNGCFDPDAEVTRGELYAIASRLVMQEKINMSSADVHWAMPYLDALVNNHVMNAMPIHFDSTHFDEGISRNLLAMFLVSLAKYRGEELEKLESIENNIDDSPFCEEAVFKAYSAGLLTGKGNDLFDPDGTMTRAEMCVVFCRLMKYVPREEVVVQPPKKSDFFVTLPNEDKWKVLPEVAHEYLLDAVANMYVGEDENGVYLHATAPALPEELADCTFRYGMDGFYANSTTYLFQSPAPFDLKPGESHAVYLENLDYGNTPFRSKSIGDNHIKISVYIHRPMYGSSDRYLTVVNSVDDHLQAWDYDFGGSTGKYVPADVSHVFAQVKK
ncbi:MAG: S-layer homology domain-containing protein [Ruminococcaceae bacterium]|nr:S-layer homology domain-containing protein [Oscillospiraceae bacterium]